MYKGTLTFDRDIDAAMLPNHLAESLRHINAQRVNVNHNRISFAGGIVGSRSKWDILLPFGFGDLTVDSDARQLRYRLSFRQLVVSATLMAGILSVSAHYLLHSPTGLLFAAIGWAWLVGLNLFIGIPRFKNFVKDAIKTAPCLD